MDCFNKYVMIFSKTHLVIIYLFCLLSSFNCFSQDTIDTTSIKKTVSIWKQLGKDGKFIGQSIGNGLTQPLRWQKDDFITAAAIAGGTTILYIADNDAKIFFEKQNDHAPKVLKEFGWYFGSPQNFFMLSAGIYGFGLITKNEKVIHTGVLIIASATTAGIIQSLSKNIVGRARPYAGDKNDFDPFSKEGDYHSFPSGHAVLSFSMAHSIAKQFDNVWIKSGVYAIGSIAPVSRLWDTRHWLTDVGLGIALSIVVVDGVDNFMKKKSVYNYAPLNTPKQIKWSVKATSNSIGIVGMF